MSSAVILMAVGLGVLSGGTAQADTNLPSYTCGSILQSQPFGNLRWIATNCTGPIGNFDRGIINTMLVCNIVAAGQPNGPVTVFVAMPNCR
ncbi:MAG: hypothetical protein ACRDTG_27865 [Pseudonocardiaceae bacterium]